MSQAVGVDHPGHQVFVKRLLSGSKERQSEPPKPARVIASGPLAGSDAVLAEDHVQHSVHRLDASMAADRIADMFAAEIPATQIAAHLT